jgi:aspartate racemase
MLPDSGQATARLELGVGVRTFGVIGGMGPLATAVFLSRLRTRHPAQRDQDHPRVLVDCDPALPDRTQALCAGGASPREALTAKARGLEQAGAEMLLMPCNTAHAFLPHIRAAVAVPVVDMIAVTAERAVGAGRGAATVGVLATEGTIATDLYGRALRERGAAPMYAGDQQQVNALIRDVKGGRRDDADERLTRQIALLAQDGAQAVILGCTELSLPRRDAAGPVEVVDCLDALTDAALAELS